MKFLLVLPVLCIVVSWTGGEETKPEHTLKKYPGLDKSRCGTVYVKGCTQRDKQTIVRLTNQARAWVAAGKQSPQPPAADMIEVRYDEGLAKVAQRWAEQCNFGHDENRGTATFPDAGQNTYEQSDSKKKLYFQWNKAVESWFKEVKQFSPSGVDSYSFSSVTGHYTQLVWGNTSAIGCGCINYKSPQGGSTPYKRYYVCNYGPQGNIEKKPVYIKGRAGSKCKKGPGQIRGLCKPTQ